MSDKQAKFFGKKTESAMMPKGKKRPVKESVETKLSFKQMVQLVQLVHLAYLVRLVHRVLMVHISVVVEHRE